jgi:hypothetical protein
MTALPYSPSPPNGLVKISPKASIVSGAAVPGRPAGVSRHKPVARQALPAFSRRAVRDDRPTFLVQYFRQDPITPAKAGMAAEYFKPSLARVPPS